LRWIVDQQGFECACQLQEALVEGTVAVETIETTSA
jgi:hypothetical protein